MLVMDTSGQFFGDAVEMYLKILEQSNISQKAQRDTAERHGQPRASEVFHYCLSEKLAEHQEGRVVITRAGRYWRKSMLGEKIILSGKKIELNGKVMELLS